MTASPDITTLSTETVWKRRTQLDVVKFRQRRFDGTMSATRTWEVWLRGRAVGVLPYDPVTDQLVMIEQFRYPALLAGVDPVMLEVPGGFMDAGETEEQTAIPRNAGGDGAVGRSAAPGGRFVLSAGGSDESATIFAGRIAAPAADADGIAGYAGLAVEHEDIRTRVLPAMLAIENALAGRYTNSITAMALLWFASRRDWLRQEWKA